MIDLGGQLYYRTGIDRVMAWSWLMAQHLSIIDGGYDRRVAPVCPMILLHVFIYADACLKELEVVLNLTIWGIDRGRS